MVIVVNYHYFVVYIGCSYMNNVELYISYKIPFYCLKYKEHYVSKINILSCLMITIIIIWIIHESTCTTMYYPLLISLCICILMYKFMIVINNGKVHSRYRKQCSKFNKQICDWAYENQVYLHKLHMFIKWYFSWSLLLITMFCNFLTDVSTNTAEKCGTQLQHFKSYGKQFNKLNFMC